MIGDIVNKLKGKGLSSIVISNVLAKFIAFAGGLILVQILNKEEYGQYSYVVNLYGLAAILADVGAASAFLQHANENDYDVKIKRAYIPIAKRLSFAGAMISCGVIAFLFFFYPFSYKDIDVVFVILLALPFFQNAMLLYKTILRADWKNTQFSIGNISYGILFYIFMLPFSYIWGVKGAVASMYPTAILSMLIFYFFARKTTLKGQQSYSLSEAEKKSFYKFSLASQANEMTATLLNLLDVYCLGRIIKDANVLASYKVASTIPTALNFLPQSILVFAVPYFSKNLLNKKWCKKNYKRLVLACSGMCIVIALICVVSSGIVIPTVYGKEYTDAILCFNILVIGFVFYGGLQCPAINILYTQRKIKYSTLLTSCAAVLDLGLNVLFINRWKSPGAAIATALVHMIVGIAGNICVFKVLKERNSDVK